jgi:hypothetical protein
VQDLCGSSKSGVASAEEAKSMSAPTTSTVLANLNLQIQDNLNSGQATVNRVEPVFSYPASIAAYASYLYIPPSSPYQLYPNLTSGPFVNFLFVRNVTQLQNSIPNQIVTVAYTNSGFNNEQALIPGGWMVVCNPANLSAPATGGLTNVRIITSTGVTGVVEYLYAV